MPATGRSTSRPSACPGSSGTRRPPCTPSSASRPWPGWWAVGSSRPTTPPSGARSSKRPTPTAEGSGPIHEHGGRRRLTRRGRGRSIGSRQMRALPAARHPEGGRRDAHGVPETMAAPEAGGTMASKTAHELRRRMEAAWENLSRQLHGMDAYLERADAPGEWTTREILSHLLFAPGSDPARLLATFAERDYPLVEITPGDTYLDDRRRQMTLAELREALDAQRRQVLAYLDTLEERDFERKARIPLFKQFMGTDEITIAMFVGALFDYHWNDHVGHLARIRHAVGLATDVA